MAAELTPAAVLAAVPHRPPFRFLDEIVELDREHIVGAVRFLPDAPFYAGHFPGNPVTPGVLLLEAMAQAGVVAHGIFLLGPDAPPLLMLFTAASVEWSGMVRPGERVLIHGRKVVFRRRLLRSVVTMTHEDGREVATGTLTGIGVPA
jgi:3-hydroxyacyl-[acyl-carrier-protein] dehydratase